MANEELPIIQKTYDLILWYVPCLNKFPRDYKFILGDRIQTTLYVILEGLIVARYRREKIDILENSNAELDILRYQTRLCLDFKMLDVRRYSIMTPRTTTCCRSLPSVLSGKSVVKT
ncbi:MAG: diversity-generating retroelement protein Avd [Candidatus Sumerlaeota bacterium]|nr:diversity-generating retroelement protein Avd [Candidatus Sumerlaeota bacterium]